VFLNEIPSKASDNENLMQRLAKGSKAVIDQK